MRINVGSTPETHSDVSGILNGIPVEPKCGGRFDY